MSSAFVHYEPICTCSMTHKELVNHAIDRMWDKYCRDCKTERIGASYRRVKPNQRFHNWQRRMARRK